MRVHCLFRLLITAVAFGLISHAIAAPITVDNFKNQEIIRYPVPLIRGTLADTSATNITIKNLETGKEIAGVTHKGKFKLLTELKPGKTVLSSNPTERKSC